MNGEINTLLSDYALAAVTAVLAWRLRAAREGQASRTFWAIAFAALALGAFAGGTYHGFRATLPAPVLLAVWKATVLAIGAGAAAMIVGSAAATGDTGL